MMTPRLAPGERSTVRVALRVNPAGKVPEIVTVVSLRTCTVVTVKLAVVSPVGTVTLGGKGDPT